MKLRNLFFFGFFIFICIALFLRYNPSFQRPINNLEVPIIQLDPTRIESFILSYQSAEAIFSLEDQNWIVSNGIWSNEISLEVIDGFLKRLSEIKSLGIYGQSDRAWPKVIKGGFNVVEVKTYHKRDLLAHFLLAEGTEKDSLGNAILLLKQAGSDVVYQVDSSLKEQFLKPINRYRSNQILNFSPVIVQKVHIKKRDSILYELNHFDSLWVGSQGYYLETSLVENWLSNLSSLKGEKFADRFNELNASAYLFREIDLFLENRSAIRLSIFSNSQQGKSDFIVNSNQFPDRYFNFDSTKIYRDILPTILQE